MWFPANEIQVIYTVPYSKESAESFSAKEIVRGTVFQECIRPAIFTMFKIRMSGIFVIRMGYKKNLENVQASKKIYIFIK